jgi:hypothetical protein
MVVVHLEPGAVFKWLVLLLCIARALPYPVATSVSPLSLCAGFLFLPPRRSLRVA